jgi:hypothetical protein
MKKRYSEKIQISIFLFLLIVIIVFHSFVLLGIIPFDIVWGGKLKNHSEMISLERISLFITILMLMVGLLRAKIITFGNHPVKISVMLYTMSILFGLNSIGNLLADTNFEKFIFTPITLLLALLSWQLARTKTSETKIENT